MKTTTKVNAFLGIIVGLILLFEIYAVLVPQVATSGSQLNESNRCNTQGCFWNSTLPLCQTADGNGARCSDSGSIALGGLFGAQGIVILILMATLIIIIVKGLKKTR